MLTKAPLQGKPKADVVSAFASLSLTACVTSVLELDSSPAIWENFGFDWFNQLDIWCHEHRLQVLNLTAVAPIRGFHIRFFCHLSDTVQRPDGEISPRLEATVFVNNELIYNPSEADLSAMPMHNTKLVFVPYDPTPTTIKFVN